jgi:hypothetical protein
MFSQQLLRSLNTQQPAAGLWLCDVRSAAAVEGALVIKTDGLRNDLSGSCSIFGIILCRLQHAATQTLWPLMLPLHLFFRSLLSALPLPSFFMIGSNSLSLPFQPSPHASQAGIVRLTMSTLPAQWASAVVVGDGDYAFTGDFRNSLYVFFKLTSICLLCSRPFFFATPWWRHYRIVSLLAVNRQRGASALHPCCCGLATVGCRS